MIDQSLHSNVIIVGGGLTGCSLACLLAKNNIRCLVISKQPPVEEKNTGQDPRTLAITRGSENILRATGAWQLLDPEKIGYFREMFVWEENGDGDIHFDSADLCEPSLGTIIEQSALEQALQNQARQCENIDWIQSTPSSFARDKTKITIKLEDNSQYSASLLVGTDGANSTVRSLAKIAYPRHDYHQRAVACIVKTEKPHLQTARQRFINNGPLAFLPMADPNQCGVVWSTSPHHAEELLSMETRDFNRVLAEAFENRLGNIKSLTSPVTFPLFHAQAETYCQQRLALAGDAAHTVHPLAGQGANLGLLDAATLAEIIINTREKQHDIGNYIALRRYERWRKSENYLALKILQGFKYLFESRHDSLKVVRNIGLDLADAIHPFKHVIMRHAMGLSGDLPVFARQIN